MRLATVAQSREIEHLSQEVYAVSSEILMESAGALAAREVDQSFYPELARGMTAIVCGPGNNGADGLVVARHLYSAGHRDLYVFIMAPESSRSELFNLQLKRLKLQSLRVVDLYENPEKQELLRSASLIVDALFGTGLSRPLTAEFRQLVDLINSCRRPVVSLDCPSGLDCDTGVVTGSVVRANMTVTFGLAKPGFFVADGPLHVGKIKVFSIGFPYETFRGVATTHFLFTERLARRYLPSRQAKSHKGDHGHLLLFAGSPGLWGAGVLASSAAFRMGVGYVTWASFTSPQNNVGQLPEVLYADYQGKQTWQSRKISAVAVGPGLGVNKQVAELLTELKNTFKGPVVVDADAINTAVQFGLFPFPKHWLITPHMAELARIVKIDSRELDKNRFAAALKASEVTGCHVLVKGFRSVLAHENRCMVIQSGNSALAKAGTGDVLTGMVGALMAQQLETTQAAATGAYVHGRMADEWVRLGHDRRSLSASDIKEQLPQLMSRIAGGAIL